MKIALRLTIDGQLRTKVRKYSMGEFVDFLSIASPDYLEAFSQFMREKYEGPKSKSAAAEVRLPVASTAPPPVVSTTSADKVAAMGSTKESDSELDTASSLPKSQDHKQREKDSPKSKSAAAEPPHVPSADKENVPPASSLFGATQTPPPFGSIASTDTLVVPGITTETACDVGDNYVVGAPSLSKLPSECPFQEKLKYFQAVQQILDKMRMEPHNRKQCQLLTLRELHSLLTSTDDEKRSAFRETVSKEGKCFDCVALFMKRHKEDASTQSEGCSVLALVAEDQFFPTNLSVEAVVEAMQCRPNDIAVQISGCRAICEWSRGERKLYGSWAMSAINATLSAMEAFATNQQIQKKGCAIVLLLAFRGSEIAVPDKQIFIDGCMRALMRASRTFEDDTELQRDVYDALPVFCDHVAGSEYKANNDEFCWAFYMLNRHRNNRDFVDQMLCCLGFMLENDDNKLAASTDQIKMVVSVMKLHIYWGASTQINACQILALLGRRDHAAVAGAGGINAIMNAVHVHPQDGDVRYHGLMALRTIVNGQVQNPSSPVVSFSLGAPHRLGTKQTPYQPTTRQEYAFSTITIQMQSISAMEAYQNKNHEELRYEDYMQGNRGVGNAAPPLISQAIIAMRWHVDDVRTQSAGCSLLSLLAQLGFESYIIQFGGVHAIVSGLIANESTENQDRVSLSAYFSDAQFVLVKLVEHDLLSRRVLYSFFDAGGIHATIVIMRGTVGLAHQQYLGLWLFKTLLLNHRGTFNPLLQTGGVAAIVVAMMSHPESKLIQVDACIILAVMLDPVFSAVYREAWECIKKTEAKILVVKAFLNFREDEELAAAAGRVLWHLLGPESAVHDID